MRPSIRVTPAAARASARLPRGGVALGLGEEVVGVGLGGQQRVAAAHQPDVALNDPLRRGWAGGQNPSTKPGVGPQLGQHGGGRHQLLGGRRDHREIGLVLVDDPTAGGQHRQARLRGHGGDELVEHGPDLGQGDALGQQRPDPPGRQHRGGDALPSRSRPGRRLRHLPSPHRHHPRGHRHQGERQRDEEPAPASHEGTEVMGACRRSGAGRRAVPPDMRPTGSRPALALAVLDGGFSYWRANETASNNSEPPWI